MGRRGSMMGMGVGLGVAALVVSAGAVSVEVSELYRPGIAAIPRLRNDRVVFQDFKEGSYRLYVLDPGSSNPEAIRNNGPTTYLYPLAFDGSSVTWVNYTMGGSGPGGRVNPLSKRLSTHAGPSGNFDIVLMGVAGRDEQTVSENSAYKEYLAVDNGKVVWTDYRFYDKTSEDTTVEVFLYDGSERQLTNYACYKAGVDIQGSRVVWQDYRSRGPSGLNADIYLYELGGGGESSVCTEGSYQDQPSVHGNIVVWQDFRDAGAAMEDADIYGRDLSGGDPFAICDKDGYQCCPRVYGDYVVWQDYRHAGDNPDNADIYLYRISTEEEIAVTTKDGYQGEPVIDGDYIVWMDYTDTTLYRARIDGSATTAARPIGRVSTYGHSADTRTSRGFRVYNAAGRCLGRSRHPSSVTVRAAGLRKQASGSVEVSVGQE